MIWEEAEKGVAKKRKKGIEAQLSIGHRWHRALSPCRVVHGTPPPPLSLFLSCVGLLAATEGQPKRPRLFLLHAPPPPLGSLVSRFFKF